MKCAITGHTRGLGKHISDHLSSKGFLVDGYSTSNGYELTNINTIVPILLNYDLVILNAYANGTQIDYINHLHDKVKKIIVCGSIAGDGAGDPNLPEYSNHKKDLRNRVLELSTEKRISDILYLKLTSSSYKDNRLICDVIDFWLNHPDITSVSFNIYPKNNLL